MKILSQYNFYPGESKNLNEKNNKIVIVKQRIPKFEKLFINTNNSQNEKTEFYYKITGYIPSDNFYRYDNYDIDDLSYYNLFIKPNINNEIPGFGYTTTLRYLFNNISSLTTIFDNQLIKYFDVIDIELTEPDKTIEHAEVLAFNYEQNLKTIVSDLSATFISRII